MHKPSPITTPARPTQNRAGIDRRTGDVVAARTRWTLPMDRWLVFGWIVAATVSLVGGGWASVAAQEVGVNELRQAGAEDLRQVRARAIRLAVSSVADSVVLVELIGVQQPAAGEVSGDAPTVAVALDEAGHFIASSLVVRGDPTSILLVAPDGRRAVATVVARDSARQLVLLKTSETLGVPPLPLADISPVVGQTVIAVGRHAAGQSPAVSTGVLSATGRNWGLALQTDARVSSAFYGGPLIDLRGRVLGIIVPMVPDGGAEDETGWYDSGVAFAIGSPSIVQRLDKLMQGNDIRSGLVGIVAKESDPYVESTAVAAVRPRSPAQRAGILAGDQIESIDSVMVRSHREIKQMLGPKDAGTVVEIEVRRGDQRIKSSVTLAASIPTFSPQRVGMTLAQQTVARQRVAPASDDQTDQTEQTDTALVVTGTVTGSPADGKLVPGDRILSVDGAEVAGLEALRRRIVAADPDNPLTVQVVREGEQRDVVIQTKPISAITSQAWPDSLRFQTPAGVDNKPQWSVEPLDMPDISNPAVLIAPRREPGNAKTKTPWAGLASSLGLLVVMADPSDQDLKKTASAWSDAASAHGVIVCVIGPSDSDRWTPEEIEVPSRVAAALRQTYPIDASMQAIAGAGKGPGGSIALATALLRGGTFAGLSVSPEIRPPAIRLKENDPATPLQILIPSVEDDDPPGWIGSLEKVGYPVLRTAGDHNSLLQWVRTLSLI